MSKEKEGYTAYQALGIIETQGRAPLIEAVDSAIKAAAVTFKASYFVGGGFNAVTLVGDVGAMRAALDAATGTINRIGAVGQTHLIPRLAPEVWSIIEGAPPIPPKKGESSVPDEPPASAEAPKDGEADLLSGEEFLVKAPSETKKPRKRARKPRDTSS